MAEVHLSAGQAEVKQLPVDASLPASPEIEKILAEFKPKKTAPTAETAAQPVKRQAEAERPTTVSPEATPKVPGEARATPPSPQPTPAAQSAETPKQQPPKTPPPPKTEPTTAAAGNQAVELAVIGSEVRDRIEGMEAGKDNAFVLVSTRWKATGTSASPAPGEHRGLGSFGGTFTKGTAEKKEPYLVPRMADALFLVAGGKYVAPLASATGRLPHGLTREKLELPAAGDPVEGEAAFVVRKQDMDSLSLAFIDSARGNIEIPIKGSGGRFAEKAALGTQAKENIKLSVYGYRCTESICEVDLGLESTAERTTTEFDLMSYLYLVGDGHYYRAPLPEDGVYTLRQFKIFRPGWEHRGMVRFPAVRPESSLTLFAGLPETASLTFELTPDRSPPVLPASQASFADGAGLSVEIIRAAYLDAIPGVQAPTGAQFIGLDVLVRCPPEAEAGVEMEPAQQFQLFDERRRQLRLSPLGEKSPYGAAAKVAVLPGMARRFSLFYEMSGQPQALTLDYSGFEKRQSVPLSVARTGK